MMNENQYVATTCVTLTFWISLMHINIWHRVLIMVMRHKKNDLSQEKKNETGFKVLYKIKKLNNITVIAV